MQGTRLDSMLRVPCSPLNRLLFDILKRSRQLSARLSVRDDAGNQDRGRFGTLISTNLR